MLPNADHVWLQESDLVECCTEPVKVLFFLEVVGLHPKDRRSDASHTDSGKLHTFAGRIEFPKVRLAHGVSAAKLGDLPRAFRRRLAQEKQGDQQGHHHRNVDDFPTQRTIVHAAISRVLRKK